MEVFETPSSFQFTIPRLATERLHLRELRMADFEAYARHSADPEATRFLGGVVDRRTAWRLFAASTGGWVLRAAGWWAIDERASGEHIGMVGAFFRETSFDDGDDPKRMSPDLELGWVVYQRFQRKGYASEAADAALRHGVSVHAPDRVTAYISEANVGSVGVARRIGMRFDKEVAFYGTEPVSRYVLFPNESRTT